jgi:hypothetical protein
MPMNVDNDFVALKIKVEEAHGYLFSKGGVRDRMGDFITRKNVWSFLTLTFALLVLAFITINNMWADSKCLPEKVEKIETASANHETRLSVTEMKNIEIERRVTNVEKTQTRILENTETIINKISK